MRCDRGTAVPDNPRAIENNLFHGTMAGVVVDRNGGVKIGAALPAQVVKWLETVT